VIGVFVYHNLIAAPVPARDDVVIVRRDVPVEVVEPEAFPVPASKHELVLRSKAAGETSVRPRLIDVVVRIVSAAVMSHPLIVAGVDVREFGMALPVRCNMVLGRMILGRRLRTSCRIRRLARVGRPSGSRFASRSGPACGNVSTANFRRTTAAMLRRIMLRTASLPILRKSGETNQNRQPYKFFQANLPGDTLVSPARGSPRVAKLSWPLQIRQLQAE